MNVSNFGGNRVRRVEFGPKGRQGLCSEPYCYFYEHLMDRGRVTFDELASFSVFVLRKDVGALVQALGLRDPLEQGDCVQAERSVVTVRVEGGNVGLLIAGTTEARSGGPVMVHHRFRDLYKVVKPWGHELWINGQHPHYALKQIAIKAGTKTSLQYHHFKRETNLLVEGAARLHYRANPDVLVDAVMPGDTASVELTPVSVLDVSPPTLHRLEAVTDVLLYEASTAHLDDVVRVQDDNGRRDGRIAEEHPR